MRQYLAGATVVEAFDIDRTSDWLILMGLSIGGAFAILIVGTLLYGRWKRQQNAAIAQAKARAKVELARTNAQTALDTLYLTAIAVVGPGYDQLKARFETALDLLGEDDQRWARNQAAGFLHRLDLAQSAYGELSADRTTDEGGLCVHTVDAAPNGYSLENYTALAKAADRLRETIQAAQPDYDALAALCEQLEAAINGAASEVAELTAEADETVVAIDARQNEGYKAQRLRKRVSAARGLITRAYGVISYKEFISARRLLENASNHLRETQAQVAALPERRTALEAQALMLEQHIDTTMTTTLPRVEARLERLRRRYERSLFHSVGRTVSEARVSVKQLSGQLVILRQHVTAYELDEAEGVASGIEQALQFLAETNDHLDAISAAFEKAAKDFDETTPKIVAMLDQLEASIRGRKGLQETHLTSVTRLRARLTQAHTVVRTNPIGALGTLDAINKRITQIGVFSLAAHQKHQASQEK